MNPKFFCSKCQEPGHKKSECTSEVRIRTKSHCAKCGKDGHKKKECREKLSEKGHGFAGGDRACFKCGKLGHRKADCPGVGHFDEVKEERPCFKCGKMGHKI